MSRQITTKHSVRRLLDANANRALEGARVCEDVLRFYMQSPVQFRRLRALRHAIAKAIRRLPFKPTELLVARESGKDLGRKAPASRMDSLERLLLINFQRMKESLRALEECSRLVAPQSTPVFQRLRFRTYGIERDTLLKLAALRHR